jgi:hypothetical protein
MAVRHWRIWASVTALPALYFAMASLMSMREILDARFFYSANDVSRFFAELPPGRAGVYLEHQLLDLLFLSSYSVLSFSLAGFLFPGPSKLKSLALVPGVFDLIETSSIIAILLGAPIGLFAGWLGFATCLKWSSGGLLTVVSLGRLAWIKVRQRK